MSSPSASFPLNIRCGNHEEAPWSIVCIHLVLGQNKEWMPVESDHPEVEFDWFCPSCKDDFKKGDPDLNLLRPICIHCVRHLRERYDANFKEDEP